MSAVSVNCSDSLILVSSSSHGCRHPQDFEQVKQAEREAISRVTLLERRLEEREQEMEVLLNSSHEQRAKTVEGFESLLASERAAKIEASQRAESLSLQLQTIQGELDVLQAQLTTVRNHETALETRVRAFADTPQGNSPTAQSRSKRPYQEAGAFLHPNGVLTQLPLQSQCRLVQETLEFLISYASRVLADIMTYYIGYFCKVDRN